MFEKLKSFAGKTKDAVSSTAIQLGDLNGDGKVDAEDARIATEWAKKTANSIGNEASRIGKEVMLFDFTKDEASETTGTVAKRKLPAGPKKSSALATVLSLIPGAGHYYLGQKKKAAVMLVTAPLSIFIAWRDAQVCSRRFNERGTVGDWEFFWHTSKWMLTKTRNLRTIEVVIANEKRVIDNSASDSLIQREFRIQRKWSASCSIEEERIQTTTETTETSSFKGRLIDLPIVDRFRASASHNTKTLQTTLREKFTRSQSEEHTHEESVRISVPPRSHTTLHFNWKHQVSRGILVLEDQFKNRITAPFEVVIGMTFDQTQIDELPAA